MGSTGHSLYGKGQNKDLNSSNFGISNAVPFKGKPPAGSNISKPSANNITLKIPIGRRNNILFQFKLSKDSKLMTITGFRDGVPEVKTTVDVDAGRPSLSKVIASGSSSEKAAAIKMRELFNQSGEISENQLGSIANTLLRKKTVKGKV